MNNNSYVGHKNFTERRNREMISPILASEWIKENEESFRPPICNKLMYRNELSVMFVGGPNNRTDFHVDESSELFFQLKGTMELPILERKKRRVVKIRPGDVFLLPGRIPHSPQRPEAGSIGLVLERKRDVERELDCMRWYEDFETCKKVQFERFFPCRDLGKDLVPIAESYRQYLQETGGTGFERLPKPPIQDDEQSTLPDPVNIFDWCQRNEETFKSGATLNLFCDDHPDKQFKVFVSSEVGKVTSSDTFEVFLYQISGSARLQTDDSRSIEIEETGCFVLAAGAEIHFAERSDKSLTLLLYCDPLGKK